VEKVVGGYHTGGAALRDLAVHRLTHLWYAFATIGADGTCVLPERAPADIAVLAELKRRRPGLRVLVSVGGWGADGFSDAALTYGSRLRLVDSLLARCFAAYPDVFDGVDLDWEFPVSGGPLEHARRPEDRRNMTLLAAEFRRQLGAAYLVTAALPAGRLQAEGAYDPAASFELAELGRLLDLVNLMTYDMGTAFSPVATFDAPLAEVPGDPLDAPLRRWNNVTGAVDYYLAAGVPAGRLVLGVPFYGRGFRVYAPGANDGLYQPYADPVPVGDFRDIAAGPLAEPGWRLHRHPVARSPWLYHPVRQVFVSYEDAGSIGERARFAAERGLRGVFTWHLGGDDDAGSLLAAMAEPMAGPSA
jgi:chitinase